MNKVLISVPPDNPLIDELIDRAFEEDLGTGDATTNAIIDEQARGTATWQAKADGVVTGLNIAQRVFRRLDAGLEWSPAVEDGTAVESGQKLVSMQGKVRALLTAERTALNIAQRMSGIATQTARFVAEVKGLNTKILDTRKIMPGLQLLEKDDVAAGGGTNHRMRLYDSAMIKDNHIVAASSISKAIEKVRRQFPDLKIEVETTHIAQVEEALGAKADIIMLDNMAPPQMEEAVGRIGSGAKIEASGNITIENVREVAETGVDYISVGALTHSVQAFDISQTLT